MTMHGKQSIPFRRWGLIVQDITERDAIPAPLYGAFVYVIDDKTLFQYHNTGWTVIVNNDYPVYANEAAAVTGGLATGRIYRTSTGELRIKL